MYMNLDNCMYMVHTRSWIYMHVCTWHIHVHECTCYVWTWYRDICTSSQPMLRYRIHQSCTGSVHTGIYMLRMAMPGGDMYSVMICIYMVHTRTYNVQTCTYVVHRLYIWYAYTTMLCSAVLWHEQLMKYVCTTHNQCYGTGFPNPVHTVFKQGYTC